MQAKSLRSGETATDLPARCEKPRLSFRYSLDSSYLCFFPYRLRKFVEILNRLSRNVLDEKTLATNQASTVPHRPLSQYAVENILRVNSLERANIF